MKLSLYTLALLLPTAIARVGGPQHAETPAEAHNTRQVASGGDPTGRDGPTEAEAKVTGRDLLFMGVLFPNSPPPSTPSISNVVSIQPVYRSSRCLWQGNEGCRLHRHLTHKLRSIAVQLKKVSVSETGSYWYVNKDSRVIGDGHWYEAPCSEIAVSSDGTL